MLDRTAIDALYEEAKAVLTTLERNGELSLQFSAGNHFRKMLLLAAASYFEHRICESVLAFVNEQSGGSVLVRNFVKNKAISRQYHTWFSWEGNNANAFYGLFGDGFRSEMKRKMEASEDLRTSVKDFLELGNERNKLVHQDYATFPLEKTLDEIFALYRSASTFVEVLPASLRDHDILELRREHGSA